MGSALRPAGGDNLRAQRKGRAGRSWHTDETYIKVGGIWKYLYRAIDRDGNLIDSMLSEHRDMDAAKRFFKGALEIAEQVPERVTTDGHDSYPRAIRETLGVEVVHRCNPYLNNRIEQDHRGIKQRYYPMRGFGSFVAAARFCPAFEEQRQYFRAQARSGEPVSLAERPHRIQERRAAVKAELAAA